MKEGDQQRGAFISFVNETQKLVGLRGQVDALLHLDDQANRTSMEGLARTADKVLARPRRLLVRSNSDLQRRQLSLSRSSPCSGSTACTTCGMMSLSTLSRKSSPNWRPMQVSISR